MGKWTFLIINGIGLESKPVVCYLAIKKDKTVDYHMCVQSTWLFKSVYHIWWLVINVWPQAHELVKEDHDIELAVTIFLYLLMFLLLDHIYFMSWEMAGIQLLPHWYFLKNLILPSNLHLTFKIIEIIHLFSENNKIKLENNRKRVRKPQKTWRWINTLLKNKQIKGQVLREIKNTWKSMKIQLLSVCGTRWKQCCEGIYGIKCICQRSLCGRGSSLQSPELLVFCVAPPGQTPFCTLVIGQVSNRPSGWCWVLCMMHHQNQNDFPGITARHPPSSSEHPTEAGRLEHPALHSSSRVFHMCTLARAWQDQSSHPALVPTPAASTQANVPVTETSHSHTLLSGVWILPTTNQIKALPVLMK